MGPRGVSTQGGNAGPEPIPQPREEVDMAQAKMPHEKHEEHLCYLQNLGFVQSNLEEWKALVRNPKFVCKNCGRAAASDKNLCAPDKL
jgi:hypothetical protein